MVKAIKYEKEFYNDFIHGRAQTVTCIHVPEYRVTLRLRSDGNDGHAFFADKPDLESSCDWGDRWESHNLPAVKITNDIDIPKDTAEAIVRLAKNIQERDELLKEVKQMVSNV